MKPTIISGDGLELYKYKDNSEIRVGDIITYQHPNKSTDVVHRIIKVEKSGVITRGDNNNKIDPYLVRYENIEGKIIAVKRGSKLISKTNGELGYFIHRLLIIILFSKHFLFKYPRIISDKIYESKLLNFLNPLFKTKVIKLNNKDRQNYLLLYKSRVIGKKKQKDKKWWIKFPYKYFIDEDQL